ncbi:hypothetical protein [Paraburkholderia terrae]
MTMRIVAETYHGNRRRETMPDSAKIISEDAQRKHKSVAERLV